MKKEINKFLYWAPRILSIMLALFLTIFSWDVLDKNLGFWQNVLGLLIHNTPTLLLVAIIWISWKYEIVGGFAFIIVGISHMVFSILREVNNPWYFSLAVSLILDGPAFVIGILFLVVWFKKKNAKYKDLKDAP